MARAHEATINCVVNAGKDFGVGVMGDNSAPTWLASAKWLEGLGCDYIIHHIGFDERGLIKGSARSTNSTKSCAP